MPGVHATTLRFGLFSLCFPVGLIILAASVASTRLDAGEAHLKRSNPQKYRMLIGMITQMGKYRPSAVALALPLPKTNAYQEVEPLTGPRGKTLTVSGTGDEYLVVKYSGKDFDSAEEQVLGYEFLVTLYDIETDFSQVRPTTPYRKDAAYTRYTSRAGKYVDPDHPEIVAIARKLALPARDNVDFARRAYEYVAENYRHSDRTGFRSLAETLEAGGGHCGDLSAIFISILRKKGIPARHLAGHRYTGETHIISEFYVEGCGWIPVDVDSRVTKPQNDYFGNIPRAFMPVVFSRDASLPLEGLSGPSTVSTLQRGWWWWEPKKARTENTFLVHSEKAP